MMPDEHILRLLSCWYSPPPHLLQLPAMTKWSGSGRCYYHHNAPEQGLYVRVSVL